MAAGGRERGTGRHVRGARGAEQNEERSQHGWWEAGRKERKKGQM